MRTAIFAPLLSTFLIGGSLVLAQRPGPAGGDSSNGGADEVVSRLMRFDKNNDGKLTKDEVTDERLIRIIDRADADHDGFVTKAELTSLANREPASGRGFGGGFPGGPSPGGGPGGPMMGRSRPGEILPTMLQERLGLSAEQKTELEALQKEVDSRLEKILNEEQRTRLKAMRDRGPGPGGFGPPGGGRPGGSPPSERPR